jgi:hypothetical protein
MASVTGNIGDQNVVLDNAATEATLKLILQALTATTKEQKETVSKMIEKSGLNPEKVQQANKGLSGIGLAAAKLGGMWGGLTVASDSLRKGFMAVEGVVSSITSGAGESSQVFGAIAKLNGPIGLVAYGLQQVAKFQEDQLKSYQALTNAGISFGGSLTDVRLAASGMYLTMDQFVNLMTKNSQAIARMGGSANDGAEVFRKLGTAFVQSRIGDNLRGLGYTSEQLNQGLIDYISITGGRTNTEMLQTQKLTAGAARYLEQLDDLADVTGKSRDEIAKQLKQQQETADMELYKASLSVADREKFTSVYNDALAKYGQGAADNVLAAAQGRAVTTEAGKKYAALAPMAAQSLQDQYRETMKHGIKSRQAMDAENAARVNNSREWMRYSGVLGSATDILKGNETAAIRAAKDKETGMNTEAAITADTVRREEEKKKREESTAAAAAETKKAMQQIGNELLVGLMPAVNSLMNVVNKLVSGLAIAVDWLSKSPRAFATLEAAIAGVIGGFVLLKTVQGYQAVGKIFGKGGAAGEAISKGGKGSVAESIAGRGATEGGGLGASIKSVGMALATLGPLLPEILLGAVAIGGAIIIVGAAIAGATWLLGKALPTFAEGLMSFNKVNGMNLLKIAAGTGALALSMSAFIPFGLLGLPAAFAMNMMADGIVKLNSVDPAKLEKVAAAMQKVKDATPGIGQTISAGISGLVSKVIGTSEAATPRTATAADSHELNLVTEVRRLNSVSTEMLKVMKDAADNIKKNVDATKSLNKNLFPT